MSALQSPESLFHTLQGIWVKACKDAAQAQARGRAYDAAAQFRAECAAYNAPRDIVEDVIKSTPWTIRDRAAALDKAYREAYPDIGRFYQENSAWAFPLELEETDKQLRPALEAQLKTKLQTEAQAKIQSPATVIQFPQQSQGAIAAPEIIEQLLPSQPSGTDPRLQGLAEKMAAAYQAYKLNVRPVMEECSDRGVRLDRFVFEKPLEISFDRVESIKEEVLSNAGLDPESDVVFMRLPDNKFEIHVPRSPDQWRSAMLLEYLTDAQGINVLRTNEDPAKRFDNYLNYVRQFWSVNMTKRLQVPFMIDLTGNLFSLDIASHALLGGASDGGKSVGFKNIIALCMMLYPPEWLQVTLMDFKGGITLNRFNHAPGKPGLRSPYLTRPVVTDTADFKEVYQELLEEFNRRTRMMTDLGVENIMEYNALMIERQTPQKIMSWGPTYLDEVGALKQDLGEDADWMMSDMLRRWRSAGMPVIASTQYPTKEQSFAPSTRVNFNTKVAYACDENCATYIFGESRRAKLAAALCPPGDCLVKQRGVFLRGQTLFMDNKLLSILLTQLASVYSISGSVVRKERSVKGVDYAALLDGGGDPSPGKPELRLISSTKGDLAARVQSAIAKLGDRATITSLTREVFGVKGGTKFGDRQEEIKKVLRDLFETDNLEEINGERL